MSMDFDELTRISNNPSRVISTVFNDIEKTFTDGAGTLNSSDHPFAYAVDLIVGTNYGFISRLGDSEAKTFKVHARTISDLSKQMSDEDWNGIFAEPSNTKVRFIISQESLDRFSLQYDNVDGNLNNRYRKLVIPADTQITIAGIPFLVENPVEIRIMDHGGYQVVYDSDNQSRLNPLTTNTPDTSFMDIDNRRYLAVHLPLRQLKVTQIPNRPVNNSTGYREPVNFEDSLYAVRAFFTPDGTNQRNEMSVIRNNEVYNPAVPTLVIDVIDDVTFEASIPSVYIQNGLGIGRVTILVYTTKGAYYRDLTTLKTQYHSAEYFNYKNDKGKLGVYEEPFRRINDVMIDSLDPITGGRAATPFEELKNLMIYGHRQRLIPVSNTDLSQFMLRNNYSSVRSIDMVTSRLYRVTKDLPIQEDKLFVDNSTQRFNSSIGTHVGSILTSLDEIVGTGWGIDNGKRITLLQRAGFDITQQVPYLVPKFDIEQLLNSTNQNKIDTMNAKTMVYNPFAYVFDTTKDRAAVRLYRVNTPTIKYQTFRSENVNLGVQVAIGQINIVSGPEEYTISIRTQSSDAYKQITDALVGVQLSFSPTGSATPATMRATFAGIDSDTKERIFVFHIPTRYDIDDGNQIDMGGFNQFGRPQASTFIDLSTVANFIFTYSGPGNQLLSKSDMKIDQTLFDSTTISMIETEYAVEFARPLESLYSRIRPMVGEAQYKKYTADVPDVYTESIYETETVTLPNGDAIERLKIGDDGKPIIVHRAGDQRFTSDGKPVWKFTAGQTMYDDQEQPIPLEPRKMKYYFDFIGFDYNYMVSQDDYDTSYMDRIDDFFVDEVITQLDGYNRITLDETKLVFKPRSTMGFTRVVYNEAIERILKTDLSFGVTYSLTKEGLRNENLKDSLITSTHRIINDVLRQDTVGISDIQAALRQNAGTDVLNVKVVGNAGTLGIDIITNIDTTNGFSVRKVIDQTADRYLTIKEDIDVQFKRHYLEE